MARLRRAGSAAQEMAPNARERVISLREVARRSPCGKGEASACLLSASFHSRGRSRGPAILKKDSKPPVARGLEAWRLARRASKLRFPVALIRRQLVLGAPLSLCCGANA